MTLENYPTLYPRTSLVWICGSGELGILPIGEPVLPGESAVVSRKVVRGMIDGMRCLRSQGIIHRDVCLLNLTLKRERNDVNVTVEHQLQNSFRFKGELLYWQ